MEFDLDLGSPPASYKLQRCVGVSASEEEEEEEEEGGADADEE